MKRFFEVFIVGTFVAVVAAIIFVKAGRGGGQSGGVQASQIISASGSTYAQGIAALEGG